MYQHYKLCVLGSGGIGKTSVTVRFEHGIFVDDYDPTIEGSYRKQVEVDGMIFQLETLDTNWNEEYQALKDFFITNSDGYILLYSITTKSSFIELEEIRDTIIKIRDTETFPCVIVGNKMDLEDERFVIKSEGEDLAKKWGIPFFEVSAKLGTNVQEAFHSLIRQIYKLKLPNEKQSKKENCYIF